MSATSFAFSSLQHFLCDAAVLSSPSTMPQCVLTFGDPPTRCIFAKCKKSEYFKAHYDEYYEMKANYHCAAEEVAIMGRSLVVASEVHRTPLERRGHVQAAVNMIMWYVMNMDQEAHWRRQHNAKFFGGGTQASPSLCVGCAHGTSRRE